MYGWLASHKLLCQNYSCRSLPGNHRPQMLITLGACTGNRCSHHIGSEHEEMELYIGWKYEGMLWWWTVNRVYCFRGAHCLLGVDCSLPPKRQVENVHRVSWTACRGTLNVHPTANLLPTEAERGLVLTSYTQNGHTHTTPWSTECIQMVNIINGNKGRTQPLTDNSVTAGQTPREDEH